MEVVMNYAKSAKNFKDSKNGFFRPLLDSNIRPMHASRIAFVDSVDKVVEQYMTHKTDSFRSGRGSSMPREDTLTSPEPLKMANFSSLKQPGSASNSRTQNNQTFRKVDSMAKIIYSKEYQKCESIFDAEYCKVNEVDTLNIAEQVLKKIKKLAEELKIKEKTHIKEFDYFLPSFIIEVDSLSRHIFQSLDNFNSLFNERKNIRNGYALIAWKNLMYEKDKKLHENELAKARKDVVQSKEGLTSLRSELENAKKDAKLLSVENEQFIKLLSEKNVSLQKYSEKLEAAKSQCQEFHLELQKTKMQLKQINSTASTLQAENQQIFQDNKKLAILVDRESKEKKELHSEQEKLHKKIDALNLEKKVAIEESSMLKKEIEETREKLTKPEIYNLKRDHEIDNLKKKYKNLTRKYDQSQESLHNLQNEFDIYRLSQTETAKALQQENSRYCEIIKKQKEENEVLQTKLVLLEEKMPALELLESCKAKSDQILNQHFEEGKKDYSLIDIKKEKFLDLQFLEEAQINFSEEVKINLFNKARFSQDETLRGRTGALINSTKTLHHSTDKCPVEKSQSFSCLRLPTHKLIEETLHKFFRLHYEPKGTLSLIFSDQTTMQIDRGVFREVCAQLALKIKNTLKSSSKTRENIENYIQFNEDEVKHIIEGINREREGKKKSQFQDSFSVMNISELGNEGPIKKPQTLKIMQAAPREKLRMPEQFFS